MARTDRHDPRAQTNSLLLLGIVDLLEEKGLLDKDQFLQRLATFKDETIDIGLFWNTEDELRGDAGYHCGGQQVTERMAERIGLSSEDRVLDAGCGAGGITGQGEFQVWGCGKYGEAAEMPFEDNSFDVIWSQGALPFTGDVKQIFQVGRLLQRTISERGRLVSRSKVWILHGDGEQTHRTLRPYDECIVTKKTPYNLIPK